MSTESSELRPPWEPGSSTGIGSLPGVEPMEAARVVTGELPSLPALPELPERGPAASIIGRGCAVMAGLAADLQPAGWRLVGAGSGAGSFGGDAVRGGGLDQRRARSLLREDLDAFGLAALGRTGPVKIGVVGPLTLAASVERPRGGAVLADPGARRDLAQSLGEGVGELVIETRRRLPAAPVVLQLDEPSLPAVLSGQIPTPSGFSRYRAVEPAEVVELIGEALRASGGAHRVVHCCAGRVPVRLLLDAGADGISFDHSQVPDHGWDPFAEAVEAGASLFAGIVPSTRPGNGPTPDPVDLAQSTLRWWRSLGFDAELAAERVVVTPTCGLAGADPEWARTAMELARSVGEMLADQ